MCPVQSLNIQTEVSICVYTHMHITDYVHSVFASLTINKFILGIELCC